jgi:hypothetical protein
MSSQAIAVDPIPQNGSSTTSGFFLCLPPNPCSLIHFSGNRTGNVAGCGLLDLL